jgi:hypothetical protein
MGLVRETAVLMGICGDCSKVSTNLFVFKEYIWTEVWYALIDVDDCWPRRPSGGPNAERGLAAPSSRGLGLLLRSGAASDEPEGSTGP